VPCGTQQQTGKHLPVPAPDPVKVVADGKHYVKVITGKRLQSPSLKPDFSLGQTALRAAAMLARIVQNNPIVTVGTRVHVISERICSAVHDVPRSPTLIGTQ